MSATPRSLYLYSSFQLLRLTGALFTGFTTIIPTCVQLDLSYFLQSYKTHIFLNAYIFSEKLASTIYQGFNVPHLLHLFITKIKYHHAPNNAIAVKIAGWIKGHIQTRKMNALCLPSFSSRILDLGYISSACCLGLLGVKVGTILWTYISLNDSKNCSYLPQFPEFLHIRSLSEFEQLKSWINWKKHPKMGKMFNFL